MARKGLGTVFGLVLSVLLAGTAVRAQDYSVVRYMDGDAYVQGAGNQAETQALTINMPVMAGDNVWTNRFGRLAILLQDGNLLWLGGGTRVEIDQLPGDNGTSVLRAKVWKGMLLLEIRVWNETMASTLVSTPSASLSPTRNGLYLVDVENVDRTRAACLSGRCLVGSADTTVALEGNQTTYADYGYPPLRPIGATEPASSALLAFRREHMPKRSSGRSSRYLPSSLAIYANDFDENGSWVYSDPYGFVWHPRVLEAEWSPYMNGYWAWNTWGMTWVPFEVWGWAPFHYGRWTFLAGIGWGWIPMPYFAPAWVSWYWGSAGWLGWCPLGWDGYPYWYHGGWYSVPIGQVYVHHLPRVIARHRRAPPPHPIYPRARGNPGSIRGGGPRSRGGPGTSPVNLPPKRVRAYVDGRVDLAGVGRGITRPVSPRASRTYPPVRPRVGRGGGFTRPPAGGVSPGRSRGGGRSSGGSIDWGKQRAGPPTASPPAQPRQRRPVGPPTKSRGRSSGSIDWGRQRAAPPVYTPPGATKPRSANPRRSRPAPEVRQPSRSRGGYRSSPSRSSSPRVRPRSHKGSTVTPRYIPSRPSTGMRGGQSPSRPTRSAPPRRSKRKH